MSWRAVGLLRKPKKNKETASAMPAAATAATA